MQNETPEQRKAAWAKVPSHVAEEQRKRREEIRKRRGEDKAYQERMKAEREVIQKHRPQRPQVMSLESFLEQRTPLPVMPATVRLAKAYKHKRLYVADCVRPRRTPRWFGGRVLGWCRCILARLLAWGCRAEWTVEVEHNDWPEGMRVLSYTGRASLTLQAMYGLVVFTGDVPPDLALAEKAHKLAGSPRHGPISRVWHIYDRLKKGEVIE